MKVKRNLVDLLSRFKPFEIVITVESEEEARGLYAIFNRTHNTIVLPRDMPTKIRNAIGKKHYRIGGQITGEISYHDYYPGGKNAR